MKKLIVDLDGTITLGNNSNYAEVSPNKEVVKRLRKYKSEGFSIVISTARNMRTYSGNVGEINIHTLPTILTWLDKHQVPYDEVLVGKPWCGFEGFYIDDKAIRPSEFVSMTHEEIMNLLEKENKNKDSGNEK
ncbi:MAG: capsular biosynthesis protein [Peredibacter sp.]|nr:capsular biosynthesis protein [Peredibacter sp.]